MMQVFQRGVQESLVIGHDVVVTVLEIMPSWVRLGINDPSNDPEYWEETLFLEDAEGEDSSLDLVLAR
ncbi:MAG TPA: carbon storage regulator [Planctomycetaceae bacterium]|nr:carbon storage regulator [Planctomycetaceae bacterium]